MVIPEGYKKTEVGIIPEDWDVVPLLEKCQLINGLTYHPTNVKPYGTLVLRSSNIQNDDFAFTDNVFVDIEVSDNLLIKSEDILICVRNGSSSLIGKCAMASKNYNATFGAFMAVLRGNNNGYIYQLLLQKTIQKAITKNSDSAINQITNGDLKKVQIPFPTAKKERDTIVSYLSDLDILIKGLNRLITKKKNIKQGAMQELLTGKRRLPGFDGEWINNTLNSFGSFVRGNAFPLPFQGIKSEKYPFYKVSDFNNLGNKRFLIKSNNYISEETARELNCNIIPAGSIVFATIGAAIFLERKKLTTVDCCIDNNTMSFQPHTKSSTKFLWYVFQQIRFCSFVEATALPSLSGKTVGSIIYRFPPTLGEQIAIAEVLSDMDNEIEELEKKLTKYRCLKQGMMSELLSGHIRLTEKEGT